MSTEAKMSTEDTRKEVFELLKKSGDIIVSPSPQIQSRQQVQSLQQIQSRQQVQSRQPVQQILKYLEEAAGYVVELKEIETYSPAKEVIVMFTTLLKEESKRTKKKEEIVVIYQLFASATFCATYLIGDHAPDDLDIQLNDLSDELKRFVLRLTLAPRKYHAKFRLAVVHFLKATDFKKELIDITENVDRMLQTLGRDTAEHIENCTPKILAILERFAVPTTRNELKAQDVLKKAGGDVNDVIFNDEKLKEIEKVFDEHVNKETKNMLRNWDLDKFLKEDMEDFSDKIDDFYEDFKNKNTLIIDKLNAGPHNLIENREFRKVWEGNVKGRRFVDEICGHFKSQFDKYKNENGKEHPDGWTIPILAQIMFHPPIVDAIDDDGSEYISVQEFNTFLKQMPEGWSTPEWFVLSSRDVAALLNEVTNNAKRTKAHTTDEQLKEYINSYLEDLPMIRELIKWYDASGYRQHLKTDLQEHSSSREITRLMDDYKDRNKRLFNESMQINDGGELISEQLQKKFEGRTEVWIIPFLATVLEQHKQRTSGELIDVDEWDMMDDIIWYPLFKLGARMKSLERRWSAQKINKGLQATSFSGGILSAWYSAVYDDSKKEFQEAYQAIKEREAEDDDDEYYEGDWPGDDESTQDTENTSGDALVEIQSLRASVSELQTELRSSVAELTRMMQKILLKVDGAAGNANATSDANQGQERQNDDDEQPNRGSSNHFNVAGNEFSGGYAMGEVGGNYNEDENPNEENEEYGASNQGSADPPEDEDEGAYTYENSGYEE
ncbi:hypothetical protein K435DRAFT_784333 [Dendrothele bispora CBS 962.96]|uniref:EF-hand domain-containing protein n=1 Tax=Dendrothele bispora (strain CBS 962.96) TaxID=1314807 RepID=A0A4S8L3N4_DENBC|nr:hypothetical protein K435DRAFT_784333 [Dendrothele bispora CBS 962.96]